MIPLNKDFFCIDKGIFVLKGGLLPVKEVEDV